MSAAIPRSKPRKANKTIHAPRRRDHASLADVADEIAIREPFRKTTATISNPQQKTANAGSKRKQSSLQSFIDSIPLSGSLSEMSARTDRTLVDNLKTFSTSNYIRYVKEKLISDAVASSYLLHDGVEFTVLEKPNDGKFACYYLLAPDGSRVVLERTPEDSILIVTGPKCTNVRYIGLEYDD